MTHNHQIWLLSLLILISGCRMEVSDSGAATNSLEGNSRIPSKVIRRMIKPQQWKKIKNRPYDGYVILRGTLDADGHFRTDQVVEAWPDGSRNEMAKDLSGNIQILPFMVGTNVYPNAEVYTVFYEKQNPHLAYAFGKQLDTVGPSNADETFVPQLYRHYYGTFDLYIDNSSDKPEDILIQSSGREGENNPLLVFLHGMGDSPKNLELLFRSFAESQNYTVFLPCGSVRMSKDENEIARYNWDPDRDPARTIRKIRNIKNIEDQRIILAGFSAGASMAYLTAIQEPELFAGVVGFSGSVEADYLPQAKVRKAASKLSILIVHGTEDSVVPVELGREAREWFSSYGYQVEFKEFDGGHRIPADYLEIIEEAIGRFEGD